MSARRIGVTLSEYVERRNGVPLGARGSLTTMLHRSLGAATLAGFWRYWNPIWGYYLSRYVKVPLRTIMLAAAPSTIRWAGRDHTTDQDLAAGPVFADW